MGNDPITRAVTAAGTMGMSEVARAGVDLAQGKDPVKSIVNAGTLGAAEIGEGVPDKANADLPGTDVLPSLEDVKRTAETAVSDTADPLSKIKRRSRTLLTGGLGVPGSADVQRKSLLGM